MDKQTSFEGALMISIATLAISPDRGGALWITGRVGRTNLSHTATALFDDVDEEYDRLQDAIADCYLYAPSQDAASYARSLGIHPAKIRNLREPARALQEDVWRSHRQQVCNNPSVQHVEPRMRPVPNLPHESSSPLAAVTAPVAANYLLALWQSWLDAERERASRHQAPADLAERLIRLLPDEFILAEQPAGVPVFGDFLGGLPGRLLGGSVLH
jgi:hypothetical protein